MPWAPWAGPWASRASRASGASGARGSWAGGTLRTPRTLRTLIIAVLLFVCSVHAEECSQGFSVVAPEVAVPGRPSAVLVTLHAGPEAPLRNVTLRLLGSSASGMAPVYVQSSVQIRGRGIIPLHVPQDAAGLCTLQTLVECPAPSEASAAPSGPCPLTATAELRLLPPVRDVIVRPDRSHAAPGDTVGFWILALSHDMTLPADVLARVSVKDPAGTKVAVWEDVPLDQGVRSFSVTLSPGAALGRWRLEVAVEDTTFGADLNVSLTGPDEAWSWGWGWSPRPQAPAGPQQAEQSQNSNPAADLAMAEEHFVELRFGDGMRRVYKPNMPFIGKVEAVSSERSVRVRIKLYDNTTAIYSQDVEISSGEATFVVPAIMADSTRITMQAELVSVDGKEIESHYVLAREVIYRWNSSSQCFLLVEGVERTMQVGEEARVRVLSTCPCRDDLHYVVTTQGHVTYWSDQQGGVSTQGDAGAACQTNITFTVDSTMAPVSRLLVYYVTANGEPVSDVTTFDVKLMDKKMSVSVEQKASWSPGETMNVQVVAEDYALVCLVGGRSSGSKSAAAGGPGGDAAEGGGRSSRAVDFLDAGLSLYERQCVSPGGVRFHQARVDPRARDALSGLRRLQLDQLWLWHCLNYTSEVASRGVAVKVPEGAGQWTLWGLSLSPTAGLRFSDASTLTVFRPLGVDFRLPHSLRVGEVLEVGVKIANNLNSCVDVSALLSLKDGAHFQSSGLGFVSERLRLGPHGATSLVVRVQATAQSSNNLTAEVLAHAASSCQSPASYGPEADATAKVVRSAAFQVQPEGLTRMHTESAYFCANERIMISTSENFRFDFVPAPRNREAVVLEVRAGQGARVALSDQQVPTDWMYQVVIGDADNTLSWIGRGKHEYSVHLSSAKTPAILSSVKERTFWVSWDHNTVRFGKGAVVGKDILLKWRLTKKMKVNFIGFASSWGQTADFRVWNFNDEAGYSQVLHLDVPRSVVPGSEKGTLLVAGGMALPGAGSGMGTASTARPRPGGRTPQQDASVADDVGLQQPVNVGETSSLASTVSAFAPLPSLRHLPANSSSSTEYQQRVLESLRLRLQDLFAFLHPDGSFGDHKSHGSHRSTVTILELLSEAQAYFSVDADLVAATKRWVQARQEEDGSFAPPIADLRDGAEDVVAATKTTTTSDTSNLTAADVEQRIETTAETLVTLLEVGVETERDSEAVLKARYFLERHVFGARGPVALAALCYALVRSRSDVASTALARLRAASINQEGDFAWPAPTAPTLGTDWLTEEGGDARRREPLHLSVREFRASLYALLAHCQLQDLSAAEPVARYLFYRAHLLDIHPELTYLSVKAFTAFGQLARDAHRSLTISLATSGMELTDTLELRPGSAPTTLVLPSLPTKVFVYATGAGCATVQGLVQYSTYLPHSKTPLLEIWAGVEGEIPPPRNSIEELEGKQPILRLKTCFRWKGSQPSGVLRLDVTLFSGFELLAMNGISVDDTGNETDVHHGSRGDHVWVVMNNVGSRCAVCVHFAVRSSYVISGLRPAFARVYPSARSDLAAETFFHTHRGSTLLAGITEDDIVTWFGRSEDAGETQMSSNFKGICECGKKCDDLDHASTAPPAASTTTTTAGVTEPSSTATSVPTTSEPVSATASPRAPQSSTISPSTSTPSSRIVSSALPDLHYEINRPKPEHDDQHVAVELQLLPEQASTPALTPSSAAPTPTASSTVTTATVASPAVSSAAPALETSSPVAVVGTVHQPGTLAAKPAPVKVVHLTSTTIRAPLRGKSAPASLLHHAAPARKSVMAIPAATASPASSKLNLTSPSSTHSPSTVTSRALADAVKVTSGEGVLGTTAPRSDGAAKNAVAPQHAAAAINTPVAGEHHAERTRTASPALSTDDPSGRPPGIPPSAPPSKVAAAEHNPLWGLLREVIGPEDANPAEAEVVGTISEETKDEEQQDEDEEKLTFD